MFTDFLLAFIPIFVTVDPIGVLPVFVSLTQGLEETKRRQILIQSLVTATCLAVGFILLGKAVFRFLGITIGDFMVAGGAILFCIAMIDLMNTGRERRLPAEDLGVVPIGTPLIVGPAVLTTSLITIDQYGATVTLLAVLANILLTGMIFFYSQPIIKILGDNGSRALSKVVSLLLAAIAVMMIRKGILLILAV